MQKLHKYLKLYGIFLARYLQRLMEYRLDFLIGVAGYFLLQASGILFLWLVFRKIPALNGWSFNQLLFIYGFSLIPKGLDHLFCDNLWMLSDRLVVNGEFDRYLLRPVNPLFQLLAEVFQPDALGEVAVGIGVLCIAVGRLHLVFGPLQILMLVLTVGFGTLVYTAVKLFVASLAFWIKDSFFILNVVYTLGDFARYPVSIYSRWIQAILSFVLPFAFAAFIPAAWFVGKIGLPLALFGTMAAGSVSFTLAYLVWKAGIQAYESAGN
jgi:ABC-2 type transport system permease protein